jgi:hypothetical protein
MTNNELDPAQTDESSSIGCLLRLYWLMGVNFALLLLAFVIEEEKASSFLSFSFYDGLFWVCAASGIAVRYLDVRFFLGQTGDGKPATMTHVLRYGLLVLAVSAILWVAAHAMATR